MVVFEELPDWERLLAAERHLQQLVPGTALHARHRQSLDGDHVMQNLRGHFDAVLADLEVAAGWETNRVQRPVLILGALDGVLTGIRQLRRERPLEVEIIEGLRVPTLAEMARINTWLLAIRHTVRDYLDTVVLLERLGEARASETFREFDEIYRQPSGASPLSEAVEHLAAASPGDLRRLNLESYKGLVAPWNSWDYVIERGRHWAPVLANIALEAGSEPHDPP